MFNTNNFNISKHFFLDTAEYINEIMQPLGRLDITYFTFLKRFTDGTEINLSNSALWLDHYYNFKLYESSLFERDIQTYNQGVCVWPHDSCLPVFKHARQYFDSDNGITFIEKDANKNFEFYFFSGSSTNYHLVNLYINNIDLFKRFIIYFKNKAQLILAKAEKNRIRLPLNNLTNNELTKFENCYIQNLQMCNDTRQLFIEDTKLIRPFLKIKNEKELNISNSEFKCIVAILKHQGHTAKEIANILFRSKRTIEKHLESIKIKLECKNKSDLMRKLQQNKFDYLLY